MATFTPNRRAVKYGSPDPEVMQKTAAAVAGFNQPKKSPATGGLSDLVRRGDRETLDILGALVQQRDKAVAENDLQNEATATRRIFDILRGRSSPNNAADAMMTKMLSR